MSRLTEDLADPRARGIRRNSLRHRSPSRPSNCCTTPKKVFARSPAPRAWICTSSNNGAGNVESLPQRPRRPRSHPSGFLQSDRQRHEVRPLWWTHRTGRAVPPNAASNSMCRISAPASPRSTSRAYSSAFTASTKPAPANQAAPAWARHRQAHHAAHSGSIRAESELATAALSSSPCPPRNRISRFKNYPQKIHSLLTMLSRRTT